HSARLPRGERRPRRSATSSISSSSPKSSSWRGWSSSSSPRREGRSSYSSSLLRRAGLRETACSSSSSISIFGIGGGGGSAAPTCALKVTWQEGQRTVLPSKSSGTRSVRLQSGHLTISGMMFPKIRNQSALPHRELPRSQRLVRQVFGGGAADPGFGG